MYAETSVAQILINNLNDDCLLHIFKFVNGIDLIHLEAVCQRTQKLCPLIWKEIRSFDVNSNKLCDKLHTKNKSDKVKIYKSVLLRSYRYLTEVNLSSHANFQNTTSMRAKHACDEIKLEGALDDVRHALSNCEKIQELSLCKCMLKCDNDYLGRIFKKNTNLRSIALCGYGFIGECLTQLPFGTIESIVLRHCYELELQYTNLFATIAHKLHTLRLFHVDGFDMSELGFDEYDDDLDYDIRNICDFNLLKNLRFLELSDAELFDDDLKPIVENCIHLKFLDVSFNFDLTNVGFLYISSLAHLLYLNISSNYDFKDEGLEKLTKNLRELNVSQTRFTANGLLNFLRGAQNLEKLTVAFMRKLNNSFIRSAAKIVKSRPENTQVIIEIQGTSVKTSRLNDIGPIIQLNEGKPSDSFDKYV
ncbi:hypothetical protein QAD02_004451 [Eretmocerus hayati]|uniref:Uncharacterized protein n=1 Tax=Eretmocerus hayati TaxID=131215 RepID=A0ACC2NSB0_9HYME|nr:hypothetical protein QAD02_004451 [Eretmocerus hayati]